MKTFTGKVVSTRMQKTVIVAVPRVWRHPLYKKAMTRTTRYVCHNDALTLAVGDSVKISETKPISRKKHFQVIEKIS